MILHAASIAAFFVDQLEQAPVQVQYVQQATPESWLKQWIPTAVSLVSVGIGVWIADRSIRKNRELTLWSFHATSERDHERWVLDQKKAEWKELLDAVNDCQDMLPLVDLLGGSAPVGTNVVQAYEKVRKLQQILFDRLFIEWEKIVPIMSAMDDVIEKAKSAMTGQTFEYAVVYNAFVVKVRKAARKDLGIEEIAEPDAKP